MKNIKIFTLSFFLMNVSLFSQELNHEIKFFANIINKGSWWYENNNYGKNISENEMNYIYHKEDLKTTYHAEISNAYTSNEKFSFGQTYIKHAINDNTFIRLGKYYRDFSLYLNDSLTTGSMLVSKNAQPIPKIGVVSKYNLKNNSIYFDFGIAHGYFDKNEAYKQGPFLHEKFIYINFKKNDKKIVLGFVHDAMWGGDTVKQGKLPSSFKDFLKVFIADDGPFNPNGFHQNAIGNHLGIWDFYFEKVNYKKKLKLYYQHFFEDTSSLRFANKTDGLWGIEMENFLPETKILIEYLTTKNCCIDPPYQDDDYYGNYQYIRGWRYKNHIVGNPLVNTLPASNSWSVADKNRELVSVINFGLEGKLLDGYYQIQAFKSINMRDDIRYKIVLSREMIYNVNFNFLIANDMKAAGISYAF